MNIFLKVQIVKKIGKLLYFEIPTQNICGGTIAEKRKIPQMFCVGISQSWGLSKTLIFSF